MSLTAVIANLNGEQLLPDLLDSLAEPLETGSLDGVIVSDDGSTDASREAVQESKVPARFVEKPEGAERGFASNVNRGVSRAESDAVAVLNSDLDISGDPFPPLLARLDTEDAGAVAPLVVSVAYREESAVRLWASRGLAWLKQIKPPPQHTFSSTDWRELALHGAFFLVRREQWVELGGFDERFTPAYWEDVDLGLRLQQRGRKLILEPSVEIAHQHSVTVDREMDAGEKMRLMRKNQLKLVQKHRATLGLDGLPARLWQAMRGLRASWHDHELSRGFWKTALGRNPG